MCGCLFIGVLFTTGVAANLGLSWSVVVLGALCSLGSFCVLLCGLVCWEIAQALAALGGMLHVGRHLR
jgi:hypothetical protein